MDTVLARVGGMQSAELTTTSPWQAQIPAPRWNIDVRRPVPVTTYSATSARGMVRRLLKRAPLDHPRRCTARSARTGEPCRRYAARGASVCRLHGAEAPQVKAPDVLVQRLFGLALDGQAPDAMALNAIRDGTEPGYRTRMLDLSVGPKAWEQGFDSITSGHRSASRARRGEHD